MALTTGAAAIDVAASETFNNLTLAAGTKTIAAGDTLVVNGSTTLTAGALNGPTGTLAAQGAVNLAAGYGGGTATLLINGTGAQTLTGSTTNAAGSLPVLVINKPSGTLTLAVTAGAFIRTTNNWTYTAGTVDPGTSTVVFAGGTVSGSHALNNVEIRGAVTVPAGTTLALAGTFTMPTAVTLTLNGAITVAGTTALTDGTLNGTGSLAAQGNLTQASTFDGGTATLLINGTGAQTFTGSATNAAGTLPPLVINKPSGTLTLAVTAGAFIRTTANWTYTAGTIDPGTSTVVFAGGTISGSHALNNVDFRATTTIAAGTTLTALGSTTLTAGALNGPTGTLAAQGAVNLAAGYGGGTATLLINGTGAQTLTGSTTNAAGSLPVLVINKPSGTLTLAVTAGAFIRTTNNWTYTAGTVDPGTSTVVFAGGTVSGSHALNNVEIRGAVTVPAGTTLALAGTFTMPTAVTLTLNGAITVAGTTALTDGTLNGTGSLAAQGNLTQASTFDGGTATLLINGTGAQTFTGSATNAAGTLPPLVINKPSGTLTLAVTAGAFIRTTANWTYTAGTIDPGTSTVVFAGTLTVSGSHPLANVELRGAVTVPAGTSLDLSGTFTMPSAVVVTLNGTITVAGSTTLTDGTLNGSGVLHAHGAISQASTFDGGTGTLRIDGSGAQTFTGAATTAAGTLPAVIIDKATGTLTLVGTIRTTANWTYIAGTVDPGTSTVVFAGNQTISGSQPSTTSSSTAR